MRHDSILCQLSVQGYWKSTKSDFCRLQFVTPYWICQVFRQFNSHGLPNGKNNRNYRTRSVTSDQPSQSCLLHKTFLSTKGICCVWTSTAGETENNWCTSLFMSLLSPEAQRSGVSSTRLPSLDLLVGGSGDILHACRFLHTARSWLHPRSKRIPPWSSFWCQKPWSGHPGPPRGRFRVWPCTCSTCQCPAPEIESASARNAIVFCCTCNDFMTQPQSQGLCLNENNVTPCRK